VTAVSLKRLAQRLRVPLGFVLAPVFLAFAAPTAASLAVGAAIAVAGAAVRAWASGHLRKMTQLTTSGPYSRTRNPLYLGTFLMVAGAATAGGRWWLGLLFGGAYLLVYVPVMLAEVDTMRALFPGQYERWAASVPLFLPRLTPAEVPNADARFDGRLYLQYREYRAALGLAAVFGFLVIKMVWGG
jgi:protein-S-isoprenylcysteine O-methyltransferase Ste14